MEDKANHYIINGVEPDGTVRVTFTYKGHVLDHAISEIGEKKKKQIVFRKINLSDNQEVLSVIEEHYQAFKDRWDELDNTPEIPDPLKSLIGVRQEK